MTKLERRYALLGAMLIAPTVLIFCAVIVYPLISAIYLSLFQIYTPTQQGGFDGFANYRELLASGEFWRSLVNTLIWTVGTLTLQILFGVGNFGLQSAMGFQFGEFFAQRHARQFGITGFAHRRVDCHMAKRKQVFKGDRTQSTINFRSK